MLCKAKTMHTSILVLPMYPHICKTTCASIHSEYNVLVELTIIVAGPIIYKCVNARCAWCPKLRIKLFHFTILAISKSIKSVRSPLFVKQFKYPFTKTSQSSKSNTLLYKSASMLMIQVSKQCEEKCKTLHKAQKQRKQSFVNLFSCFPCLQFSLHFDCLYNFTCFLSSLELRDFKYKFNGF